MVPDSLLIHSVINYLNRNTDYYQSKQKHVNMAEMNEDQQTIIDLAVAGHNLLIVGSAGTGKSYVINHITKQMGELGKNVRVTCSTGIACNMYTGACTVHRFLGLMDGRFDKTVINRIHKENAKFSYVDENLNCTDCLIIDECSMISKHLFELIMHVCARKHGHLQLIFAGDFLKLPPVANQFYGDSGQYCFEAEDFHNYFPHKVVLKKNLRTTEKTLAKAVTDIFSGTVTKETETFISTLNRPLLPSEHDIKLFSNNSLVDNYNRNSLLNSPGEIHEYISTDSGQSSALNTITAPHILWLQVGCPVILLQNLSDKLFNGLRGSVHSISSDGPVVNFQTLGLCTTIPMTKFTVFDPAIGADIAVRQQYPLKPAFGLTIHKAQGMTLDRVEIDCQDIFRPGQLGVAMSRATTSSGLRIINYHRRYVMKPPKTVTDFLMADSKDALADITCCSMEDTSEDVPTGQTSSAETESGTDELTQQDFEETFQLEDEFDKIIQSIINDEAETHEFEISEELMKNIQDDLIIQNEITSSHKEINEIVSRLDASNLQLFVKKTVVKLQEFVNSICDKDAPITKGIPESKINKFYTFVHEYSTGPVYRMHCMLLFEEEKYLADEHMIICYKILEAVRLFCLHEKIELIKGYTSKIQQRFVTDSSKARIRYVGGYCIANLRKRYIKKQRTNVFSKTKDGQIAYNDASMKLRILNALKENEQFLKETTLEPQSLIDIEKKQSLTRGLTNITDDLYTFFLDLTQKSLTLMVNENLLKFGKDLCENCFETINSDEKLHKDFSTLVETRLTNEIIEEFDSTDKLDIQSSHISAIFKEITEKYLSVLLVQFRKDVKSACKIEKKMSHRKQIKVCKSKAPVSRDVKSGVAKRLKFTSEPKASTSSQSPEPSTSQEVIGAEIQDADLCKKCFTDNDEEWIQCDSCDGWFHRKCAGLKNIRQWKKYTKEGVDWFCYQCK